MSDGFRFNISQKFEQRFAKGGRRVLTVSDQMTVTNSRGEVVKRYYEATHEFLGQTITTRDICDTTIARNIIKD